jgi:frataxin-like iron-binding protein CyaY
MAQKVSGRLQTPADSTGNRLDIHLQTTSDEVIVNPDSNDSHTLTEELERQKPIVSNSQPNHQCVWLQPKTLS